MISQELGLINASKTLIGSIPLTSSKITNFNLLLYFMKKTIHNSDGSTDLVTVITITDADVNKTLILSVLKKITDKYVEFRLDIENNDNQGKAKSGEFKLYMNQIIKFEEMHYDSNQRIYNYGSINGRGDRDGSTSPSANDVINPNQLLLANEEVEEVRNLMLDNINKLLHRGDKIHLLVDQTDRLTNSSLVFQKRAQSIKKKMWLSKTRLMIMLIAGGILLIYLLLGVECGLPFFSQCFHH